MKYAVIENGVVVNLVLWDGVTEWSPPDGSSAEIAEDPDIDIGWSFSNGAFSEPASAGAA